MRRVIAGLLVGVLSGALAYWFSQPAPPPPPAAVSPVVAVEDGPDEALAASAVVYASAQRPGLVVSVRRGGVPEAQVRVALARRTRALGLSRIEWLPVATELTDASGRALFPVAAGGYLAQAAATDGAGALAHLDVPEAGQAAELELRLEAPVPVDGQVLDATTKQPIVQAAVTLEPLEALEGELPLPGAAVARGDSLGRFAIAVPKGRWRARTMAPGYLEDVLGLRLPASGLVIELTPASTLSGRVVDSAGEPVSGVLVRAGPASAGPVRVEDDGRFSLTAAPGPVSVFAQAPDGRQGFLRPTLPAAPGHLEVTVTVGEGAALTGQVKDPRGRGVARAEVLVLAEPDDVEVARMEANVEGRFEAGHLPPGRYSVAARMGPGRRASAVGVAVPQTGPLELVLGDAGRLRGVVTDTAGQPLAFAFVSVDWTPGLKEVRRTARTDGAGLFSLDELPAAEVIVQARVNDEFSESEAVYVAAGATAELTLQVAPQARLVVLVANPKVSRVSVSSLGGPGGPRFNGDVVSGRFEVIVPAGAYWVMGAEGSPGPGFESVDTATVVVKAGEVTTLSLADHGALSRPPSAADPRMHPELGSGLSFENVAGGVRIDFLMADCPVARAGGRVGDLVVTIDGAPVRDARDAFERSRKPAGQVLALGVRREAQDVTLMVR